MVSLECALMTVCFVARAAYALRNTISASRSALITSPLPLNLADIYSERHRPALSL